MPAMVGDTRGPHDTLDFKPLFMHSALAGAVRLLLYASTFFFDEPAQIHSDVFRNVFSFMATGPDGSRQECRALGAYDHKRLKNTLKNRQKMRFDTENMRKTV
jgi:hypothetical protein